MANEIKYYKPCASCNNSECVFHGKGKEYVCEDYEPCEDVVSRQAVLDEIDDTNRRGGFGCKLSYTRCRGHMEQLPPVIPQPKTGHWEKVNTAREYNSDAYECSECKYIIWTYKDSDRKWNYCPSCGIRMQEVEE